ncbi:hypothetical protein [Legionella sp. CNM-4043-24]|uniref:hypothetical protein n=1 Tax=Legionella sp. CNM-4043-24 TaxID=3421646 RepID=UPI00403AAE2F
MTLTKYWQDLRRDLTNLQEEMGEVFDYQNYAPVNAAHVMVAEGSRIEGINPIFGAATLLGIQASIREQEALIGDPIPGQNLHQPRLNDHRDFFFAAVYFQHQQRFADVVSSSRVVDLNLQGLKAQEAQNAAALHHLIREYYAQHQESLDQLMTARPGHTVDGIRTLLQTANASSFESRMAPVIQQEFEQIISNGGDALEIVTNLRAHFVEKESTITQMYHIKRLVDALNQPDTRLGNLNEEYVTDFLNDLPVDERDEWRAKIDAALQAAAQPVGGNLKEKAASLVSTTWSFGKWMLEGTGELFKPWSPALVTDITQAVYHFSTSTTERVATGIASRIGVQTVESLTRLELNNFANQRYNTVAQNLITADNGLTLDHAHQANPEELLRLKGKMAVLNSVLVLEKHMEDFISTHNKGLVKFIDFFRPVNLFLSRTFFRYVMHDKALLLEEARQLKKSLADIKRDLEQTENPEDIKTRLLDQSRRTRTSVAEVSQKSRYVFLSPAHQNAARRAAEDVSQRIVEAIAPVCPSSA